MSEQLQGVLVGGGIAVVVALLGFIADGWREGRRIAHEKSEKRYDDLKSVYVRFATEMHRIVRRSELWEIEQAARDEEPAREPDPWDTQPEAEQALAELRLFHEALYGAGRTWLDEYYKRFWRPPAKGADPADVEGAEERFIAEARRLLNLDG